MKKYAVEIIGFTLLAALVMGGCAGGLAYAGCPPVYAKKQVILQQAYAYYPVVQYQVGAQIQQEAIIEAAVAKALARFQATVTQTTTTTQSHISSQGHATVQAQASGEFSRCTKCHTGENRTGFRVDAELSCEDRLRAISMLLHDDPSKRMPKGAQLSADELGLLIQAFSSGLPARASAVPPPPPVPAP